MPLKNEPQQLQQLQKPTRVSMMYARQMEKKKTSPSAREEVLDITLTPSLVPFSEREKFHPSPQKEASEEVLDITIPFVPLPTNIAAQLAYPSHEKPVSTLAYSPTYQRYLYVKEAWRLHHERFASSPLYRRYIAIQQSPMIKWYLLVKEAKRVHEERLKTSPVYQKYVEIKIEEETEKAYSEFMEKKIAEKYGPEALRLYREGLFELSPTEVENIRREWKVITGQIKIYDLMPEEKISHEPPQSLASWLAGIKIPSLLSLFGYKPMPTTVEKFTASLKEHEYQTKPFQVVAGVVAPFESLAYTSFRLGQIVGIIPKSYEAPTPPPTAIGIVVSETVALGGRGLGYSMSGEAPRFKEYSSEYWLGTIVGDILLMKGISKITAPIQQKVHAGVEWAGGKAKAGVLYAVKQQFPEEYSYVKSVLIPAWQETHLPIKMQLKAVAMAPVYGVKSDIAQTAVYQYAKQIGLPYVRNVVVPRAKWVLSRPIMETVKEVPFGEETFLFVKNVLIPNIDDVSKVASKNIVLNVISEKVQSNVNFVGKTLKASSFWQETKFAGKIIMGRERAVYGLNAPPQKFFGHYPVWDIWREETPAVEAVTGLAQKTITKEVAKQASTRLQTSQVAIAVSTQIPNLLKWSGKPYPATAKIESREEHEEEYVSFPLSFPLTKLTATAIPKIKLATATVTKIAPTLIPLKSSIPKSLIVETTKVGEKQRQTMFSSAAVKNVSLVKVDVSEILMLQTQATSATKLSEPYYEKSKMGKRKKRRGGMLWEGWSFTLMPFPEVKDISRQIQKMVG